MNKSSTQFTFKKMSTAIAMSMLLSACGGGSDGGNGTGTGGKNPPKPIPTANTYTLQGDDTRQVSIGQPIGLVATSTKASKIENPHYDWKVTSGDPAAVKISANHQPATSISIDKPGDYVVTLFVKNKASDSDAKAIEKIERKITVVSGSTNAARLNVDRAATSGSHVNFYFDVDMPLASKNDWTIKQISGASATKISKSDAEPYAQIDLPKVTQDEVLVFEATYTKDPSIKDTAYVLVRPDACDSGNNSQSPTCKWNPPLNHHYAYQPTTVYSDRLVDCTMSATLVNDEDFCTVGELPFIGIDPAIADVPSVEDIMSRVVVTHDWMGANFERFLREKDTHGDFRRLLRSVTAIVISEDINPAYYYSPTGAIHLEAEMLWMTPDEHHTVTSTIDDRAGNGSELDFYVGWAYEKNGKSMFSEDYKPYRDQGRSLDTISPYLTSLLYHELAHANDYMRYEHMQQIKPYINDIADMRNWEVFSKYYIAEELQNTYPLQNKILFEFAEIMQDGRKPTTTELSYTGLQMANWYLADRANDDYNYASIYEDVAMLFEETMMLLRTDTNRYFMVWDTSGNQAKIIKGQKNRITEDKVAVRAEFVAERILPGIKNEVNRKLQAMNPTPLCSGATWDDKFTTNCNLVNPNNVRHYSNNLDPISQRLSDQGAMPIDQKMHLKIHTVDPRTPPSQR